MPSVDREDSHDRELVLRHQHSGSDGFRGSIPMYVIQWPSFYPSAALGFPRQFSVSLTLKFQIVGGTVQTRSGHPPLCH